jgi:protein phosphatase
MIRASGASDAGCVRPNNEDRILLDEQLGLFIVADGMGGHSHGERAAELAVATLEHYVASSCSGEDVTWPFGYRFEISFNANRLTTGIQLANGQVWRCSQQAPEYTGMGTTVAAVIVSDSVMTVANVGDSRVYLLRDDDLQLLTVDDTWTQAAGVHANLTREQLQNHPMRNFLTQAAGSKEDLDVHTAEVELRDSDVMLLCSDGLHGVIDAAEIFAILRAAGRDLASGCQALINAGRAAGGPDNVSCIVLRHEIA